MNGVERQEILTVVGESARRRIMRRLGPFLFILYILNYLARVNLSYASLQMTRELHFSGKVFGFGAGIFFIGYFFLQIPQTMLVEKWSARKFIGIALIGWGILAAITGFINTAHQFYWIRFLLGVFEAGFFPGVIVYLTHWYRSADRAKAVALFMLAIPMSNLLGAAIAVPLLKIHLFGLSGWRWLLMIEGFPAVICGVVSLYYLSDLPKDADWLSKDEKEWITSALARENAAKGMASKTTSFRSLFRPQVLLLSLAYFCYITDSIGLGIWLPKILQRISDLNITGVILVSGIPWLAAVPAMLYSSSHSDKTGERRWHAALPMLGVGIALALSLWAGGNLVLAIATISFATMALYAFPSPFWALPTAFLSGTAAAASIAIINSIGNLGGFAGPYVIGFLTEKTGNYSAGILYLVGSAIAGGLLVLVLPKGRKKEVLNMVTMKKRVGDPQ
jgi:ACS family tartrate transporter-like MFS transporter